MRGLTSLEALRKLDSGPRGLTEEAAEERLARYGENAFPGRRPLSWSRRLASGLRDPFTAVLLCLGLVSALIASWGTACVIAVLVVVSGVLRASGEYRADRSMAALGELLPATATVRRRTTEKAEPTTRELPVDQLVPGDVVRLGPGDLVPADLRLLRATGLTVHQAALTGESVPVPKHPVETPEAPLPASPSAAARTGHGVRAAHDSTEPPRDGGDPPRSEGGALPGGGGPARNGSHPAPRDGDPARPGRARGDDGPIPGGTAPARTGNHPAPGSAPARIDGPAHAGGGPARGGVPAHGSVPAHVGDPARAGGQAPGDAPAPRDGEPQRGGADAALFAQPHLCFQGSSVASGSATGVVVATGGATRFAGAYRSPAQRRASAFDRSVNGVAWILIRFMLLTPPLVLMANAALRGRGLETLPFAVAVAVGLTPEMLPVVVTTALARGAGALARGRDVIVRRLPALHDLGAADVLCTDKTGTLTEGRPVLDRSLGPDGRPDPAVARWAALNSFWTLHLAELPVPDPLDEALLEAAGEDTDPAAAELWEREGVAALPFDPVRRISCAVVRDPAGETGTYTVIVKGAAEDVLERCALEDGAREELRRRAAALADGGLRLLAVATGERRARLGPYTPGDERGLTFVGFVGLRDALAPSAAAALAGLAEQGVAVKVLTGDHPGTAARVCRELGLVTGSETAVRDGVVTGDRIDTLDDAELARVASRGTVFARCAPAHKARVVAALRAHGHTTGYLGDGVNDLAALHTADIGLCPRDAAPVAREAADVVLARKDLTAIGGAIATGRRSGGNIASYLRIVLSSNLGNVLAMLVAGLMLPFLPMFPAQVLVQNLCFDAAQLAFAFDRPSRGTLRRPTVLRPRALLGFITRFGLLNAIADLATFAVLALAVHGALGGGSQEEFHAGWFTENLLTQGMVMLLLRTGSGAARGRAPRPLLLAAAGLAVVGLLLPLSPLGPPLGMTALPLAYYPLLALVLGLYGCALVVARTRYERRAAADERAAGRGEGPAVRGDEAVAVRARARTGEHGRAEDG